MLETFERQQRELGELNRQLGRAEGIIEQQRRQLADVQDVQQRLEAAEVRARVAEAEQERIQAHAGEVEAQALEAATRAALAEAERDRLQAELQRQRPWWRKLFGQ
jgi:hypothetical protein